MEGVLVKLLHGQICDKINCILFIFEQAESTKKSSRHKVPDAPEESHDQVIGTSDAKVSADNNLGVLVIWSEALYLKSNRPLALIMLFQ